MQRINREKRILFIIESIASWIRKPLLGLALSIAPLLLSAQENPWFFGIHTMSNNFWTNNVLSLAGALINVPIARATEGEAPIDFTAIQFHYMTLKDNGEDVDFKRNNPYGFKAYDLFNNLEVGLKVGWLGPVSPVGAYVYGAYGLNQYKLGHLQNPVFGHYHI